MNSWQHANGKCKYDTHELSGSRFSLVYYYGLGLGSGLGLGLGLGLGSYMPTGSVWSIVSEAEHRL